MVVALFLVANAQSDNQIGTWKLNLAKSKFSPGPAPKSLTLTVEAQGDGAKYSLTGAAPDGSPTMCSFTTKYDGKDSPASGACLNGADTAALKRDDANANIIRATLKKTGKVVVTVRDVVSKDGKARIATLKGTNEQGQPTSATEVFDKQ
jgi:hypothetical protein